MQAIFKKRLLSSCITALTISAISAAAQAQDNAEEIVITGIRASQQAAVDVKRNAVNIVDSIVAEDIGKLPDVTISDSLQRITGIQIDRTAGEGSSLNVRGMPQVLTTLNGEQFLSPWSITNVGANYSDIPSSMMAGLDVYKSQSASNLAGGISGVVDLKTRKPLKMDEGWTASAGIEGSEGSITKDNNHDYNAFVGWNNGDIGFTLGAFDSTTNAANYRIDEGVQYGFVNDNRGSDPEDLNKDGVTKGAERYLVPTGYGVKAYVMERDRQGLAGSFQANIGDSFVFTGDVFYTQMDQYDRGVETQFNGTNNNKRDVLRQGSIVTKEYTVPASGSQGARDLYSVQLANVHAPDFQTTAKNETNHTDALNSSFELAYDNGGAFKGSLRYVHATASKEYVQSIFQQGTPVWYWLDSNGDGINENNPLPFDVVVDYRPKYPTFSYKDDLSSPTRLNLYQGFSNGTTDDADLNAFRADGSYEFEFADFRSFDFGVRHGVRTVDHKDIVYMTPTGTFPWDDPDPALRNQPFTDDRKWQIYPDWKEVKNNEIVKSSIISYNDFGPFKGFETGVATLNPALLDDALAFSNALYPGTSVFHNPEKSYEVEEATTSAYLQGNFKNEEGIFGIPYDGNLGIHLSKTERHVVRHLIPVDATQDQYYGNQSYSRVYKSLGDDVTDHSYNDLLPSANINFHPKDDVIVRFGFSQTVSRNDLRNLGESLTRWNTDYTRYDAAGKPVCATDGDGKVIDINSDGVCDRFAVDRGVGGGSEGGNPKLKDWHANNYNISTEWYFAKGGILGASIFLIDVPVSTVSLQEMRLYPDEDGVTRKGHESNFWVTRNAEASDLKGLEIGYKQAFDFLPGAFSHLGAELNYTYSDSKSGKQDLEGNSFPLESNSKHQYNAVLWYQDEKLSSRLAYNWRSAQYQSQVGLNTNEAALNLGNWVEASGYLDASINYDIVENLTVYLQGTNILETNKRSYAQFEGAFSSLYVQERRVALGLRVRL
jgi:iron complex outermembrane receptor protein